MIPVLIAVAPGELTCTQCGETRPAKWRKCPRCVDDDFGGEGKESPPAVETISYLHPDEWRIAA